MAVRPQDTWYVSFEQKRMRPTKRAFSRSTVTFRSELKAKEFETKTNRDPKRQRGHAQSSSAETRDIVGADEMVQWLEEPTGTDAAP